MEVLIHPAQPISRIILGRSRHQIRLYSKKTINRRSGAPAILRAPAPDLDPEGAKQRREAMPIAFRKPRAPTSNAAKSERLKQSRQIEKALLKENHGREVYAYVHLRTGQVVYSLTREMHEHKIMPQLIFHGKKTVPACLRRDMWSPYMYLQFPSPYSGLLAYHQLRELSLQRQLSPPDSLVSTTKQHATKREMAKMDTEEQMEWESAREGKEYEDGLPRLLPRRERAKVLMDQRKTAVADVAFVVEVLQQGQNLITPQDASKISEERRRKTSAGVGHRKGKRLRLTWIEERERLEMGRELRNVIRDGTKWGLERRTARRIAMQHGGVVVDESLDKTRVVRLNRGQRIIDNSHMTQNPVTIFWSDPRDATYARSWPTVVFHGELERMAMCPRVTTGPRMISGIPSGEKPLRRLTTVHVAGKGVRIGAMDKEVDKHGKPTGQYSWMRTDPGAVETDQKPDSDQTEESVGDDKPSEHDVLDPSAPKRAFGWLKGKLGMSA